MPGILNSIDAWLDRRIGADMDADRRAYLMREQIRAVMMIAPASMFCSLALSGVVVAASFGETSFPMTLLWGAASLALVAGYMRKHRQGRRQRFARPDGRGPIASVAIGAAGFGILWGVLPIFALPDAHPSLMLAVFAVIAGVTYTLGFGLSVVPQAALSFMAPVVLGQTLAIASVSRSAEGLVFVCVLVVGALAIAVMGFRSVRGFVRRVELEAKVRGQKDVISLLLKEFESSGSDWLWSFDARGRITSPSRRFASMSQKHHADLEGMDFMAFLRESFGAGEPAVMEIGQHIEAREAFSDIVVMMMREDGEHWWQMTGTPAIDNFGAYAGYIGMASDVTAEKQAERRISFLAHNDALTGLLNRAKFTDQLKQAVARLERYGSPFGLMFLDLDQFKLVNDSRGHLIGDQLLIEVARRIRGAVRETDMAARLGGDEFAIILTNECGAADLASLAARLVRTVSEPYEFDDELLSIGVSIGIAVAPVNGIRPDQLLRNADLALYRAKADGRGVYRFFENQMDSDVRERRILELELREALKEGELILHYQPLVSAETGLPTGFEALMRWNHPIRGLVTPAEFIPIAEQSGLIKQIGDWTIREACSAAARWPHDLIVAVNLSAKHFQLSDIAQVVREALAESGLAPHRLELEITESLLIQRPDDVIERLTEIQALGVTIAMDDFGTGYSSLSYLMKFPFNKIKIDKSFVTASSEDTIARDILRTIASLGKTLKISITAEGVETSEQVEFLRDIACHHLQGYYFAKPLNEMDLARYFMNQFGRSLTPAEEQPAGSGLELKAG